MGAKSQGPAVKRLYKCEQCELEFQAYIELKSHVRAKHSKKVTTKEKSETKEVKKTAFVPPTSRASKRLQLRKKSGETSVMPTKKLEPSPVEKKTHFECPICLKLFPVYFSALKHIQKKHNDDANNGNSSDTDVKPILVEMCTLCNERISHDHKCGTKENTSTNGGMYSCLGCDRKFVNVSDFDQHVPNSHQEDVDVMIFKDVGDFQHWKSTMESQVQAKYLTLSNSSNKQYYQCNYVSPKNSAVITHLCPSLILLRQLRKGVKIHYHKTHHSHACPEYKVPKAYINNVVINNDFDSLEKKSDLLEKFTDLMKNILERSEGVDSMQLKKLCSLAFEMEDILNSDCNRNSDDESVNNEDVDFENDEIVSTSVNKSMTDDQISKLLEAPRTSGRIKRKGNVFTPNIMKKKKLDSSLKENNSIAKNFTPLISKPLPSSPSFNDSYKEFIETTIIPTIPQSTPQSTPPSTPQTVVSKKARKHIVKTKIGQFIPSPDKKKSPVIAPKTNEAKSSKTNYSLDNVDFEVVEQENDCNILVLKIKG